MLGLRPQHRPGRQGGCTTRRHGAQLQQPKRNGTNSSAQRDGHSSLMTDGPSHQPRGTALASYNAQACAPRRTEQRWTIRKRSWLSRRTPTTGEETTHFQQGSLQGQARGRAAEGGAQRVRGNDRKHRQGSEGGKTLLSRLAVHTPTEGPRPLEGWDSAK